MKRKLEDQEEPEAKRQKLDYINKQKEKWNNQKNGIKDIKEGGDTPLNTKNDTLPLDMMKQQEEDEELAKKLQEQFEKEEEEIEKIIRVDRLIAEQLEKEEVEEEENEGEEEEHHPIRVEKLI